MIITCVDNVILRPFPKSGQLRAADICLVGGMTLAVTKRAIYLKGLSWPRYSSNRNMRLVLLPRHLQIPIVDALVRLGYATQELLESLRIAEREATQENARQRAIRDLNEILEKFPDLRKTVGFTKGS
jgi:hypothetical protein